jgi:hypothetical protein
MANLAFQSVLPTGSRELGDAKGAGGEGIFDYFFEGIDLPGFVDRPAMLVFATKQVDLDRNFITVNAPPEITHQSYHEARDNDHYIWRILPNPSETWILQTHQINSGKLKSSGNRLGFHTRNDKGEQARIRDDFALARVFIVYYSSE